MMVVGRRREAWERTSALMALVAQAAGGKAVPPDAFNPFAERREGGAGVIGVRELKAWARQMREKWPKKKGKL